MPMRSILGCAGTPYRCVGVQVADCLALGALHGCNMLAGLCNALQGRQAKPADLSILNRCVGHRASEVMEAVVRHHIGGCFSALHQRVLSAVRCVQGPGEADLPLLQVGPRIIHKM